MAAFARSIGCDPGAKAFDLYVGEPLPPEAVLTIHTEGDPAFERIGNGYPARYIDADRGRWDAIEAQIARRRR